MIVDSHTHLLPAWSAERRSEIEQRDATFAALFGGGGKSASAEELVAAMDQDGVDVSVVLGYGWLDPGVAREANDCLLDAAARFPRRIVAFCSVHPGWGDDAIAEIERCVAAGAKGVGELHPTTQGLDIARDASLVPIARLAAERDLPIVVHGSEPVGHSYPGKGRTTTDQLLALAQRFPETTFVFAHWGGGLPFYGLMPEVRDALANVYFDSAASPFLYNATVFDVAARSVGAERLLFGSDYPALTPERWVRDFEGAPFWDEARPLIMLENAKKVLGM